MAIIFPPPFPGFSSFSFLLNFLGCYNAPFQQQAELNVKRFILYNIFGDVLGRWMHYGAYRVECGPPLLRY